MRSTSSVSTWTWTLAGCLALFLGCSQGEGDRCQVKSDCSGDLECYFTAGSSYDGICRSRSGSGAAGSSGQRTSATTSTGTSSTTSTGTSSTTSSTTTTGTGTSTGTEVTDASVAPSDAGVDAAADVSAGSDDGSSAD